MKYPEPYTVQDIKEAEENGIKYATFYNRVNTLFWKVERAKTQKPKKNKKHGNYTKRAIANGISESLYYYRVNEKKWSKERACTEPIMSKEELAEHRRKVNTGKSKYGWYLKTALANGISNTAFYQRITKGKMSWKDACTIPVMSKSECATYKAVKNKKGVS